MPPYREFDIEQISKQFQIYGEILHAEPCKIGHINETYTATYDQGGAKVRYIHQKINQNVFKRPDQVMENLVRVTSHIRRKLVARGEKEITRKVLGVIPSREGKPYYQAPDGDCWRTFVFVENTRTYEAAETPQQAFEAGKAFGNFQCLLADIDGPRLHETIPDFHHARKRFDAFNEAVAKDHFSRVASAKSEIEFALKNEKLVDVLLKAHAAGKIPERITHNDTKFNNVMLDTNTGNQICVVDLDTVMPGLALYDFGDMVRTTTSPTMEDEKDLSKVQLRLPMFEALARGYVESATFLTKTERSYLAFAGKLITFVIGLRFLTDFLLGDTYFRVHRAEHNLDRCRTQFRLVDCIAKQEKKMQQFVDKL
jgi:hypothetical protein